MRLQDHRAESGGHRALRPLADGGGAQPRLCGADRLYAGLRSDAFDAISDYDNFPAPAAAYESLYAALKTMREDYVPVSEPRFEGYYGKVSVLYDGLRQLQQELPKRAAAGEDIDALAEETWALFCSIR